MSGRCQMPGRLEVGAVETELLQMEILGGEAPAEYATFAACSEGAEAQNCWAIGRILKSQNRV